MYVLDVSVEWSEISVIYKVNLATVSSEVHVLASDVTPS